MESEIRLSVVVPLHNEEQNVPLLVEAVRRELGPADDWELVLIDDGSSDGTLAAATSAAAADSRVRAVPLARNYGQTAAMQAGFDHARGRIVVSMDGDLQNDPVDIPRLVTKLDEGYDLVAGYREDRQDRLVSRKVPSWIANRLIQWITRVPIRDNGCSLKAYRRELLERIHLYSDMHRFIPATAVAVAGARIAEIPVTHHARRFGRSKYGLSRIWKVLSDLLAMKMIGSFRERPLRMFGGAALSAGLLALIFVELTLIAFPGGARPEMANAFVFPSIALVWLSLAFYLFLLGLIGEVIVHGEQGLAGRKLPVVREWR